MRQKPHLRISLLTITLLILWTGLCQADVPPTINYQGFIADSDGLPLDGSQLITFSIYDDPTGDINNPLAGTQMWSEQKTVVALEGIINTQLGAAVPMNISDFSSPTLYLQMEIFRSGTGWEPLLPRQALTSTPFAMKAGDADTLEGLTSDDFALADHAHDDIYVNVNEADAISSGMVANDSLSAADLGTNSVGASELADGAVDSGAIASGAVGTTAISNGAVTGLKIADGAISSGHIGSGEVTISNLYDGVSLQEIKDDDGAGSGLDADLLDGYSSSAFASAVHTHDSSYVNTAGDTMTGSLTVEGSIAIGTDSGTDDDYLYMDSTMAEWLKWDNGQTRFALSDALNLNGTLAIGTHTAQPLYNSIGTGIPNASGFITGFSDLFVADDFEVASDTYLEGRLYARGTFYLQTNDDDNDFIYTDTGLEYFGWEEDLDDDETNGENGGFYFSDEIEAIGNVTTNGDFKYKTPRTKYLNIPATAFIKDDTYSDALWNLSASYNHISAGPSSVVQAYAPVYLPDGAVIQSVSISYIDNHSSDLDIIFALYRRSYTATSSTTVASATTTSTGTNSSMKILTDSLNSPHVVDSNNNYYNMYLNWDPVTSTSTYNQRFFGARIAYTIDTLAP